MNQSTVGLVGFGEGGDNDDESLSRSHFEDDNDLQCLDWAQLCLHLRIIPSPNLIGFWENLTLFSL